MNEEQRLVQISAWRRIMALYAALRIEYILHVY